MFDNGVAAAMSSKTIRINASAVQAELQLSQAGQETVFAFLGGSSVDSLATPATYTIDWGDGTAQAPDIQVLYATGAALPADPSHTFTRATGNRRGAPDHPCASRQQRYRGQLAGWCLSWSNTRIPALTWGIGVYDR